MKRHYSAFAYLTLLSGMLTVDAHADAVSRLGFERDKVMEVRTGLGITTQVELDKHEKVLDFSSGFSSGWSLSRRDNVFYVRPKDVDVDTNLIVRTESRTYIFELKVVATDWKTIEQAKKRGVQYRVIVTPPDAAEIAADPAQDRQETIAPPELSTDLLKERRYNFNYDYSTHDRTHPWLIPVNAYDDGRFTYLRMARHPGSPSGDFPAIFAREKAHGEESMINTSVSGDTIVVHGTYPYLIIRHGRRVVGIRRNATK
ncbi:MULTISPECIES: TrbG/VirB9 family P-type conjugative transfer protein [Dyella]|uniref:Type IV secretion system protein VirB9 n=2 Tax=Dyella TaxID=231454 RepID=A0A4R0YN81_9GAMM|nr:MULTISPECIES: TrbG/VirB9 family P-type conjugative transfer protein [Dyella]TBR36968.1 type IV secretion system protein VirB9 [Dyella terrae]TCI07941.1 type IV secretion system protein VirB9 [Dyella soli]